MINLKEISEILITKGKVRGNPVAVSLFRDSIPPEYEPINGEPCTLIRLAMDDKKKSYFDDLQIYQQKWYGHPEVKKQLGFMYRMIGVFIEDNKWKRLLRHPILSIAMILLRTMVGFEYLISKIVLRKVTS